MEKISKNLVVYLNPVGEQSRGGKDVINNLKSEGWSENYEVLYAEDFDGNLYTWTYASVLKTKSETVKPEQKLKAVDK